MIQYKVLRQDGTEIKKGEPLIDFKGRYAGAFQACIHPRKIVIKRDGTTKECFAGGFDLLIQEEA